MASAVSLNLVSNITAEVMDLSHFWKSIEILTDNKDGRYSIVERRVVQTVCLSKCSPNNLI